MLTVAVDYGYEPMEGSDGVRYVIHLEPAVLDALREGTPVGSMILPEVRGRVHEFRIVTNGDKLSKQVPPATAYPTLPEIPSPPATPPPTEPSAIPRPDWPTEPQPEAVSSDQPGLFHDADVTPVSGFEDIAPVDGPSGKVDTTDPEVPEPSKSDPWFLLAIASVVAVGSSGGMVFFGWLTFDYRSRYLALLRDSLDTGSAWLDEPADEGDDEAGSLESSTYPVSPKAIPEEVSDPSQTQDSAWQELGAETDDNLDDWLNEKSDKGRRSRRNKKRSR